MKKKIIIGLMSLTLLTGCGTSTFGYTYEDNYEPGSKYEVFINYSEKTLALTETDYCSFEDCEPSVSSYTVTLSKEEIKLIKKITSSEYDEEWLTANLTNIAHGEYKYSTKGDSIWEWYKEADANNDGVVTSREQGLKGLKEMIDNPNNETK